MVANSPDRAQPTLTYENSWTAITRLIHEDGSWSGHESDRFFLNLGNGQFADISGVAGFDSDRDGRAFVTLDFDNDGDLDIVLKNRNSPQLVILRNDTDAGNHSLAFELIGRESNRDAVGAVIAVTRAHGHQTKYVRLGSGFMSQSTRRLYFGLGTDTKAEEVSITWPNGRKQHLENIPADQLVTVVEGKDKWTGRAFQPRSHAKAGEQQPAAAPPVPVSAAETWLLEPIPAPPLNGRRLDGRATTLREWRGRPLLVNFWASWCPPCRQELGEWAEGYARIHAAGAEVLAVSVDDPGTEDKVRQFVREQGLPFNTLLPDAASVLTYNILHRYLFTRHFDLQIPTTLLLDAQGNVVKIYRGPTNVERLLADVRQIPNTLAERLRIGLPYPGRWLREVVGRDYFALALEFLTADARDAAQLYFPLAVSGLEREAQTNPDRKINGFKLGFAYRETGQNEKAVATFQQVIKIAPDYAPVYDQLGLAYINLGRPDDALLNFDRSVQLDPHDPLILIHLGLAYYMKGRLPQAAAALERALRVDPGSVTSLLALALTYYSLGRLDETQALLEKVRAANPQDERSRELLKSLIQLAGTSRH